MKTLVRMIIFIGIGYFVAALVAGGVMLATTQQPPEDVYERAAQGNRAAELRVAFDTKRSISITNVALWSSLAVTIYGLERLWRLWRPQSVKQIRLGCLLHWLGAVVAGLIIAIWIDSVYSLWLLSTLPEEYVISPRNYTLELAEFMQQLETSTTIGLLVGIIATILIGWLSSRSTGTHPIPALTRQVSKAEL